MNVSIYSGAGNRFGALDLREEAAVPWSDALAAALCQELELDGVLLAYAAQGAADVRMVVLNADGSRPEACGNGLRCLAAFAREREFAATDLLHVMTDAGLRSVELLRDGGRVVAGRASMGQARVLETALEIDDPLGRWPRVRGVQVDLGNPHFVLQVDDVAAADVARIGAWLERHPHFPRRTNVGFAQLRSRGVALRVWERGVGETAACGTGCCAAAVALHALGLVQPPVAVEQPGGTLEVRWNSLAAIYLRGEITMERHVEWRVPAAAHERAK